MFITSAATYEARCLYRAITFNNIIVYDNYIYYISTSASVFDQWAQWEEVWTLGVSQY